MELIYGVAEVARWQCVDVLLLPENKVGSGEGGGRMRTRKRKTKK